MSDEDFKSNNRNTNEYSYTNSRTFFNNQKLSFDSNAYDRKRKFSANHQFGSNFKTKKNFKSASQNEKEFNVKAYYDKSMIEDPWAKFANNS